MGVNSTHRDGDRENCLLALKRWHTNVYDAFPTAIGFHAYQRSGSKAKVAWPHGEGGGRRPACRQSPPVYLVLIRQQTDALCKKRVVSLTFATKGLCCHLVKRCLCMASDNKQFTCRQHYSSLFFFSCLLHLCVSNAHNTAVYVTNSPGSTGLLRPVEVVLQDARADGQSA